MKTQIGTLEKALDQRLVEARRENLRRLSDIEHRLEYVDSFDGVEYINDAKADDVNSSWYSIDCMDKPVVWIVNSCAREEDYSLYHEIDAAKIKAVVVLGSNPGALERVFGGRVKAIARAEHLMNALNIARSFAGKGDVVLYSPSITEFDSYTHYKERGQQFRKAVREMQLK